MTIDEAIKHYEEVADGYEQKLKDNPNAICYTSEFFECVECVKEHRQLAEWLRELKSYKKVRRILSQNRIATDRYGEVVLWDDIKRVLKEVNADET